MEVKKVYQNKVKCYFVYDQGSQSKTEEIDHNFIKYIAIQDLYEKYTIPVIYMNLAVKSELYSKMVEHEKDGRIILIIKRVDAYSQLALEEKTIKGIFTYIMSTSNPNYTKNLEGDKTADNSFRVLTMALFDMDLLNKSKMSYNGIFREIDVNTLVYKAVEDIEKVVLIKPKYNALYETEIIPAVNNRRKLLNYIFNQSPFYDTNFMFFMDFDRTYLLDMTGEGVEVKEDKQLQNVIFDIRSADEYQAYKEGIEEKDGAYYIYVNPANTNVTLNKGQDKVANQLVNVDEDGQVTATKLDINKNRGSTDKQSFQRGQNAILKKNIMESNSIFIDIQKAYINGTIFTPNKKYMVKNIKEYEKYDGKYVLIYKTEVITNNTGIFNSAVQFGLRKVSNIEEIGDANAKAASLHSSPIKGFMGNNPGYTTTSNMETPTIKPASNTNKRKKAYSDSDLKTLNELDDLANKEIKQESYKPTDNIPSDKPKQDDTNTPTSVVEDNPGLVDSPNKPRLNMDFASAQLEIDSKSRAESLRRIIE